MKKDARLARAIGWLTANRWRLNFSQGEQCLAVTTTGENLADALVDVAEWDMRGRTPKPVHRARKR